MNLNTSQPHPPPSPIERGPGAARGGGLRAGAAGAVRRGGPRGPGAPPLPRRHLRPPRRRQPGQPPPLSRDLLFAGRGSVFLSIAISAGLSYCGGPSSPARQCNDPLGSTLCPCTGPLTSLLRAGIDPPRAVRPLLPLAHPAERSLPSPLSCLPLLIDTWWLQQSFFVGPKRPPPETQPAVVPSHDRRRVGGPSTSASLPRRCTCWSTASRATWWRPARSGATAARSGGGPAPGSGA